MDELRPKKQKKGININSDFTINILRSDKKLKSKVASQLQKLSLKDDTLDSEYDKACTDSTCTFISHSESDTDSDYSHSSKKSCSAKRNCQGNLESNPKPRVKSDFPKNGHMQT